MTGKPALVDTNILCYAFDISEPDKRAAARRLLERVFQNEETLVVSVQNLAEFAVVTREKMENPLPDDIITRFIEDIIAFDGWTVVRYDSGTGDPGDRDFPGRSHSFLGRSPCCNHAGTGDRYDLV